MPVREQLVDVFKLFCYQIIYFAVKCLPARRRERNLLLVKTDEIGDYVLFRNLLGEFRTAERYRGYTITFIGNTAFRQLYEAYDAASADEVIWVDKVRFRRDLSYRFSVLKTVRRSGFSDAVNLIYSRSFRLDDLLIAVSTSRNNCAMRSTDLPVSGFERMLTPRHIYHRLEDAGDESLFDAIRNARFVSGLLQIDRKPVSTRLPVASPDPDLSLPSAYFVVVPGASNPNKKWPTEYFARTASHIYRQYGFTPVICGSAADRPDTEPLVDALGGSAMDLTGRTTLRGLLAVLREARCLVSIDTGAVHLAAATGCPVFGLFSGFHYGRFAPYPPEIAPQVFAIYPDEIEEELNSGRLDPRSVPMGHMNTISPDKVIRILDKELPLLLQSERKTGN